MLPAALPILLAAILLPAQDIKTSPEPAASLSGPAVRAERPGVPPDARMPAVKSMDAPTPPAFAERIDHSRVWYDQPGDGSLWARGADYKVGFDGAGATYFPLFGAHQLQHHPHALSPDVVTLDGRTIDTAPAGAAVLDGDRVLVDRGAFTEVYDFSPHAVEQSFVFDEVPRGGEFVLRIPIASDLEASERADGLEFRSDLGTVRYGTATAIDAEGRRTACRTRLEAGAVTIRVDAAFLAQAKRPLVVDPIVSTFPIDTTSFDDGAPDVSYDVTSDRWLVLYEETATSSDHDVFFLMLTSAGVQFFGAYVDSTTSNWIGVRCANLRASSQFLAAAVVGSSGNSSIRGRTIQAGSLSMGSQFTISSDSGWMAKVAVGGDPFPSTFPVSSYLVVYERIFGVGDNDILARRVFSNSTVSSTIPLSNSGGTLDGSPSVSRSNDQNIWTIAWERQAGAGANLFVGRIRHDGTIVNGPTQVSTGAVDSAPCVSSPITGTARTLLVCERDYGTDTDIQGLLLDGVTVIRDVDISARENVATFQDQIAPFVDSDGHHFLVGYAERFGSSTTDFDTYVADVFVTGTDLGVKQAHVNLAFTGLREDHIRLASAQGSGAANKRFIAAWDKQVTSTNADVLGALFDTLSGGLSTQTCPGDGTGTQCPCGNNGATGRGCASSVNAAGAQLFATGSLSTFGDTTLLTATGMPATSACLFFQGSSGFVGTPFGDGLRCPGGAIVRIGSKTASGGTASFPGAGDPSISLAGNVPAAGGTFHYQVWYRNSAVFCTSSTFNLTNGVRIVWAQ